MKNRVISLLGETVAASLPSSEIEVMEQELAKSWENMHPERCTTVIGRECLERECVSRYHRAEAAAGMI